MNAKLMLILIACGISTAPLAANTVQETTAITFLSALLGIPEPALASEITLREYVCMHARTNPEQPVPTKLIDALIKVTMALKETLYENQHLFASDDAKKHRFYVLNKGTKYNIFITQEPEPTESSLLNKVGSFIWKAAGLVGSCILVLGMPKTNTVTFDGWQYVGK